LHNVYIQASIQNMNIKNDAPSKKDRNRLNRAHDAIAIALAINLRAALQNEH